MRLDKKERQVMKFSINQQSLNEVLNIVNKAVSQRSTVPALAGILFDASENEVSFRATDLELSIQATSPALIEEDGKALLPAKLLVDIVAALPDEAVNFEVTDEKADISCANSNFSIRTLNATDYPEFPRVETSEKVTLPFSDFSKMTKRVARMTARDDSRPILQGVNVNVSGKNLELVATDAYRIAVAKAEIETENTSEFSAVIPGAFLMDVAGLKGDIQSATISLSENQVVVECNDITFINRRIAGNFPNYQQLLPEESTLSAKVNVKNLTEAVRRISVLSSVSQSLTMTFDQTTGTLALSGNAADIGSCEESVSATYQGSADKVSISFNCSYVLDGLSCFDAEEITLDIVSDAKPGIFKDYGSTIYILLPVRLG